VRARGSASEGKTVRGSKKHGAPGTHLLSAVSDGLGLTLYECAVDDKTNEITALYDVLEGLVVRGHSITGTVMPCGRNAPWLKRSVSGAGRTCWWRKTPSASCLRPLRRSWHRRLTSPHLAAPVRTASTAASTCGYQDRRRIQLRALLPGECEWPYAQQAFRLVRRSVHKATGEIHTETVVGMSSLAPEQAHASEVRSLVRDQWVIENRSHWVRAVPFDEDRSQLRPGAIPQTRAALRNAALGALQAAGSTAITASCRRFAAQPTAALALLAVSVSSEN